MEDRRNRASEELAASETELRGFRIPRHSARNTAESEKLASLPTVTIETDAASYLPGDFLTCEYEVTTRGSNQIVAAEASVIWITEGKGEEDIGVHFFERRQQSAITSDTFNHPLRVSTVLPASPLSYEGEILKIRWSVRVRLFLADGEQVTKDQYFLLGSVKPFAEMAPGNEDGDSEESN